MTKTLLLAATALLAAALITTPVMARPMTETDLTTLDRLSSPAVSPDGQTVVYQLRSTDLEANKGRTDLWRLDRRSGRTDKLAGASSADVNEGSPAFSADGAHVYFLASVGDGKSQVWRVPIGGGTAEQVTRAAVDLAGFALSPKGDRIAVWADVRDGCSTDGCPDSVLQTKPLGSARAYDQLFVRHWDEWEVPGERSRVFAYPLANGVASGPVVALSAAVDGDAPTKPFGGGEEIAWAPDGQSLYFTARKSDRNEPRSTNLDIWRVGADGQGATDLTAANLATDALPAPSPDGRMLAYVAMRRPGYESDRQVVMLRDLASGETRALTEGWDRSVGSLAWARDGRSLIVTAGDTLDTPAFRVDAESGKVTRLTERGSVGSVLPTDAGFLYTLDTLSAPDDLWAMEGGQARQLTRVNAERMAGIDPVTVERFTFAGANGDTVHGQIILPTGAAATKTVNGKLPVAFVIHGGPQGSFGESWSFRWNPMVMASQGYAAVTVDFHGSTGYGQAFTDSINQDWGGKPLTDLKLGLAAAGREEPRLDIGNACALGASYGGYMANWIEGAWPDGFRCIVQHDGVFDQRAMAFETEELWFDEWDGGGSWWDRTAPDRFNPVTLVPKWRTPMLVVTSEQDFRIPYTQGLAAFTALQRQDVPSRLLVFPDENHWVLKPANSMRWHREVFDWLAKWTRGGGAAAN